jgi:hypothetical protein
MLLHISLQLASSQFCFLLKLFFSQIRTHFVIQSSELKVHFVDGTFFPFYLTSLVLAFFPSKFIAPSFLSLALSCLGA